MKTIRLKPVRHPTPRCETYDDEHSVRRFERAMRLHRAHVEPYSVTPLDGRLDGAFRVTGATGAGHVVDIVDATEAHDTCTCPDFLGNDLGTCKHLEAVRRSIATTPALRLRFAALRRRSTPATLTVRAVGGLALDAVGSWSRANLSRLGLGRSPGPLTSVDLVNKEHILVPAYGSAGVRVVHAARPAAAVLLSRMRIARRRGELQRAFAEGRIGVDVLGIRLFPYQAEGVVHLVSAGRALLADDMGLGKTAQAIAACEVLRARGEASRILVVTVASLKHQWAREIERFAQQRAVVATGGAVERRRAFESDAPYKILNYELTWRELSQLQALNADVVIYDEAQRAKNFRTKTAGTLRAIPSRFVFVLTGTPVENRLDDLYSLMQLIEPDVLGPLWKFNVDFHQQTEKGKIIGYKNLSQLRQRLTSVVLRRRKDEVLTQLPALTEQTRYTAMTREQQELENGYRADATILMSIAERRPLSKEEQDKLMMLLIKARQACNALELCDPKRRAASPKLDEFEALVAEISQQGTSKILVFSEWIGMLELAGKRLDRLGISYAMLHGGVPSDRRPALLDRFRESPELRVLLSTDAGGVGLNLQAASYVIHLDLPWNPAKLDQRTARAHRMGQTRGVSVTYLCADQGIEWGIEKTLAVKRRVRSAALDLASDVDAIEAPSFSMFLRQVRVVLEDMDHATDAVTAESETDAAVQPLTPPLLEAPPAVVPGEAALAESAAQLQSAMATAAAEPTGLEPPPPQYTHANLPAATDSALPREGTVGVGPHPRYAQNRLRLARVVLQAGFADDAVRACYEALAAAIRELLDDASDRGHAALVAAIYRDLLPTGRLPAAAHGVLARLHDLTSLQAQGVLVDPALARQAVLEAEEWVGRLGAFGVQAGSIQDNSFEGEWEMRVGKRQGRQTAESVSEFK
jgi:superfamily II DNA or RNA helicase